MMKTVNLNSGGFSFATRAISDLTGKEIGPYLITGLIGQGEMSEVYQAVRADDQYKKLVAIKLIRQNPTARNKSLACYRAI